MMFGFTILILFITGFLEFPSVSSSSSSSLLSSSSLTDYKITAKRTVDPFVDLVGAFKKWDSEVGCSQFREKHKFVRNRSTSCLQNVNGEIDCKALKMNHVSVLVKGWTWIPDNLDNLYSCRCGLTCLWTKSSVLADKPDVLLFETTTPPFQVNFACLLFSGMNCLWILYEFELGIDETGY